MWDEWVHTLKAPARAFAMCKRAYIDRPFAFRGEQIVLADLTPVECAPAIGAAWQQTLLTEPGVAGRPLVAGTADQIRLGVQSMLSHFVRLEEIAENPFRKVPRLPGRKRERQGYYNPDELAQMADALPTIGAFILRHAFRTGARQATIRLLKKTQIDWAAKDLVVVVKGDKPLRIAVPDDMLEELRHLCAISPSIWVYPNPLSPKRWIAHSTLGRWMRRAAKTTGLLLAGEVPTVHHARHGGAIYMLDVLKLTLPEVQAQLGHANINQTATYVKMRARRARQRPFEAQRQREIDQAAREFANFKKIVR